MERKDGRPADQLRPLIFNRNFTDTPDGSVLVEAGNTRVLCTVTATQGVPPWRRGSGEGWLTAEYAMLPGSVQGRKRREFTKRDGRSVEIQRLIGRSLRAAVDLGGLPDWTLNIDCDVLQADGGTRCASISGAMVAMHDALRSLAGRERLSYWPIRHWVAAVSVGLVNGKPLLDLNYEEDFAASVDMNVVAVPGRALVEVQGTAEGDPYPAAMQSELLELALGGIESITAAQQEAVEEAAAGA